MDGIKTIAGRYAALSAAVIIITLSPSPSAAISCPPLEASPQISISFQNAVPRYDNSLTLNEIQARPGAGRAGLHAVGLTETKLSYRSQTSFIVRTDQRTGRHCTYLKGIRVHVGYEGTRVYVARKYRPGTCHYIAIRAHEDAHVRIYNASLSSSKKVIHGTLARTVRAMPPIGNNGPAAAQQIMSARVVTILSETVKNLEKWSIARHRDLDSPKSYAKTQSKCLHW